MRLVNKDLLHRPGGLFTAVGDVATDDEDIDLFQYPCRRDHFTNMQVKTQKENLLKKQLTK
jgi:hypothetical protein